MLLEKWDGLLKTDKLDAISDPYKTKVTAQLLENQEKYLAEAANVTAGSENWDPVMISLVRRMAPKLIAYDVCGVQTMTGPTGLIFALRARYSTATPGGNPQGGAEALFNEADTDYSGTGVHAGSNPWLAATLDTTGTAKSTAAGELDEWNAMGVTIEKTNVVAQTRQLRADYSLELAQDMRAIHGIDAETELSNILSSEIISEINREIVRKIYRVAKVGAAFATVPGTFDLQADADGRWSVERFKGLMFALERDANKIATETRRGKGNIIITSSDVASALAMAGILDYAPALAGMVNLDVDATGATFAGRAGRFKVYVDPYVSTDGYVVGFKGGNQYDAGFFYCPYVPLQMVRATNPLNFQPALGFKTRYGIVSNPFTTIANDSNVYYRKAAILNIM